VSEEAPKCHTLRYAGIKLFTHDVWEAVFQNHALTCHLIMHIGDKFHSCDPSEKKFVHKNNVLRRHVLRSITKKFEFYILIQMEEDL
jgi:hypothetical protein